MASEIATVGALFIQLAIASIFFGIAWLMYQTFKPMVSLSDLETKYTKAEEVLLHKSMEKKGINLSLEAKKLKEMERPALLRNLIRKQIAKDFYSEK